MSFQIADCLLYVSVRVTWIRAIVKGARQSGVSFSVYQFCHLDCDYDVTTMNEFVVFPLHISHAACGIVMCPINTRPVTQSRK